MKAKHTPGPWTFTAHEGGRWHGHVDGRDSDRPDDKGYFRSVACIHNHAAPAENEANARLIAAAPDMFETLRRIADTDADTMNGAGAFIEWAQEFARAAILKAKGE